MDGRRSIARAGERERESARASQIRSRPPYPGPQRVAHTTFAKKPALLPLLLPPPPSDVCVEVRSKTRPFRLLVSSTRVHASEKRPGHPPADASTRLARTRQWDLSSRFYTIWIDATRASPRRSSTPRPSPARAGRSGPRSPSMRARLSPSAVTPSKAPEIPRGTPSVVSVSPCIALRPRAWLIASPVSAQAVPSGSKITNVRPMSPSVKGWILSLRKVQIGLRGLELVAGLGLLALMILLSNVDFLTAWIMRIAVSPAPTRPRAATY